MKEDYLIDNQGLDGDALQTTGGNSGSCLRIVTWNCGGAFRKKFQLLEHFEADVHVIQECENPALIGGNYQVWCENGAWVGTGKKGLGIFCRPGLAFEHLAWDSAHYELFLPCRVAGTIDLLGVWTKPDRVGRADYIGQLWHYIQTHRQNLTAHSTILCGDLNSNKIWDKPRRSWNHSHVVKLLKEMGILSAYHEVFNEDQGSETRPTFYMYRKKQKTYHIDYIFCGKHLLNQIEEFYIGSPEDWLGNSDHLPLLIKIRLPDLLPANENA